MVTGSEWHKRIVGAKKEELRQKGFSVPDGEKRIGFEWPADLESQIKQPDILAENENEVVIVEVEDYQDKNSKKEFGVNFVELGGILLLSFLASNHTDKMVKLCLIFPKTIEEPRFEKICRLVDEAKSALISLQINIEQR